MLFFRVTPTGGNGDGDNYLDITGTLAAGETEITLTDSHIETDGIYDFYTSKYGVVPTDVEIAAGSVTLTFDAQSENITVMVRKWGESGGISGGGSTIEVVQQSNVSIMDTTEITLNLTKKYTDPYVFPTNVQPTQTWSSSGLVIVDYETRGVTYDSTNNTLTFRVFCNNGQTSRTYNISWVVVDLASSGSGGGSSSWDYSTTETATGQKWIDGKDVYCIVIDKINMGLSSQAWLDISGSDTTDLETIVDATPYCADAVKGQCMYYGCIIANNETTHKLTTLQVASGSLTLNRVILYYTKKTTSKKRSKKA